MTASMRVMPAGDRYKDLPKSVAYGDDRSLSSPLTRYYTETGTWPGSGWARGWAGSATVSWSRELSARSPTPALDRDGPRPHHQRPVWAVPTSSSPLLRNGSSSACVNALDCELGPAARRRRSSRSRPRKPSAAPAAPRLVVTSRSRCRSRCPRSGRYRTRARSR